MGPNSTTKHKDTAVVLVFNVGLEQVFVHCDLNIKMNGLRASPNFTSYIKQILAIN